MADVGKREDAALRDYALVVWRRKWVVLAFAASLVALAVAYSLIQTPLYKASAQLVYESQIDVADPLSTGGYLDSAQLQLELDSVAQDVASPDLIKNAKAMMRDEKALSTYSVSAAPDVKSSSAAGNTASITAVSPSADTAARVANVYAEAFTAWRKARGQALVRQAESAIQREIDAYETAAQRLSPEYLTLQQRLQDLKILEATITGNFRILAPATVPTSPFSPKPLRNAILGFVAGLVIGVGLVLLLDQFDTRVHTDEDTVAIFGMPLLGRIRRLPAGTLERQPLVVMDDSASPAAEAIRKLRGNLDFAGIDGAVNSLFITSSLQHEGKSLTVCNLALSLAAAGKRVVLVDGDLRRPQVHRYLNLPNGTGLSTVLTGKTDLLPGLRTVSLGRRLTQIGAMDEADVAAESENRLCVLTSGPTPPNPAEMIASKSFVALVAELETAFDLVIIDAPALLAVGDTGAIANCVDGLVFLVDLKRVRRPMLLEAARQVSQMPCRKLGLVVIGRSPSRREERTYAYYTHAE